MAKDGKKKEKTTVVLPKAWQSLKHRNETAQARANYDDIWKAAGVILGIAFFLFVIMGGVSQTGVLKFFFNWSHNVGETISNWLEGTSVITNEDGIYWDPTGQTGEKIKDENAPEVINIGDEIEKETHGGGSEDDSGEDADSSEDLENSENSQNSEVQNE
mgnify:CR=1 FL=1